MYCKKRNEPDGQHPATSLPPKRLMYMQHPEAELGSSLESEPTCFVQQNFAAPYADAGYSSTADRKYAVVTVGKRSCTRSWGITGVEECSKRSRDDSNSDATVSGVTFQKDLNLHHAWKPDAESDSESIRRHVGSFDDAVCLSSKRLNLGDIYCNEIDVDKHGIRHTETDVDKHVTFVCSRVQESRGNMLSVARQCVRGTASSSTSRCGQSRDDCYRNSTNTYFLSRVRDSSKSSLAHLRKAEAGDRLVSLEHIVTNPQISSKESLHAPFRNVDAVHAKCSPPSYILSSGRLSLEEEARLGRRVPTIDDDFEEYFSSLML